MSATSSAPAARQGAKHVPGEPGAWIFIFGDMCIFTVVFTAYLVNRGKHPRLFEASQETLNQNLGALNTLFLLLSSLFVVFAVRTMRSNRRELAGRLILVAAACGACFVVVKIFEFHAKIFDHLVPATNDFYLYYYLLTGLHLLHVAVGMSALLVLWRLSKKPALSTNQWAFFEGGACFWHMVDLLWIILFPLIYLVR